MTYPLIGNYGICDDDYESRTPSIAPSLIVREYNDQPSNFRYTHTLGEVLGDHIPAISGIDTRSSRGRSATPAPAVNDHRRGHFARGPPDHRRNARAARRGAAGQLPQALVFAHGDAATTSWRWLRHQAQHHPLPERPRLQRHRRCLYDTASRVIERMDPDGVFLSTAPATRRTLRR